MDNKIINVDIVKKVITKVEDIFNEEKLSMIDKEYVIHQLQDAINAWGDYQKRNAVLAYKIDKIAEKIKKIQTKKDL